MNLLNNPTRRWQEIAIESVIVRDRQRPVDEAHVELIAESFELLDGLQLQDIVLNDQLVLVDGAHRLAAAKKVGWSHIKAIIIEGLGEEERLLVEAEANRVRKQLSPVELEMVWKSYYEPLARQRGRSNQLSTLRRGNEESVTVIHGNERVSIAKEAKQATGISIDTLNKITDIRNAAHSTTAPSEIREAALRGLQKLERPGASVDPIYKSLQKLKEKTERQKQNPGQQQREVLESRLDRVLTETTLLAEKLNGDLGDDLRAAAKLDQIGRDNAHAIRVALTHALAVAISVECESDANPTSALQRVGSEVTRMLSERTAALPQFQIGGR